MKIALEEPLPNPTILKDGFWPTTRVEANEEDQLDEDGEDLEEFGEDDAYVGPLRNRPQLSFRVVRDVFEGYFVAIRPANGDSHLVWIGRALFNPNSSPENPNCILIQYFRPTSRNHDVQDFYSGWNNKKGLRWRVDETEPLIWQHTDALMTAWKSRIQKDTVECMIKIPATQIEVIKQTLSSFIGRII